MQGTKSPDISAPAAFTAILNEAWMYVFHLTFEQYQLPIFFKFTNGNEVL